MAEITRLNADALIPVQYATEIFNGVTEESIALKKLTRLPNMTAKQMRIPVLDVLPVAYWQTGDTALKNTTKLEWTGKFIEAEEIAVIVPISENVLEDSSFPIFEMAVPKLIEAFGALIDKAVFFGSVDGSNNPVNKPAGFPNGLVTTAIANGKVHTATQNESFYSQVSETMKLAEVGGHVVDTIIGGSDLRYLFRGLLDANGQPLLAYTEVAGLTREYMKNGAWDDNVAQFIVGDFSKAVYAIRSDLTYKLLTEASIYDGNRELLYALAQQDMIALRVKMRIGWQVPNPVTALDGTSTRFPFAVSKKYSA